MFLVNCVCLMVSLRSSLNFLLLFVCVVRNYVVSLVPIRVSREFPIVPCRVLRENLLPLTPKKVMRLSVPVMVWLRTRTEAPMFEQGPNMFVGSETMVVRRPLISTPCKVIQVSRSRKTTFLGMMTVV